MKATIPTRAITVYLWGYRVGALYLDLKGRFDSETDQAFMGWTNRHALSVNGKFSSINDSDMLLVGERYGIGNAKRILEEVKDCLGGE